jgi:hypothetical protein
LDSQGVRLVWRFTGAGAMNIFGEGVNIFDLEEMEMNTASSPHNT